MIELSFVNHSAQRVTDYLDGRRKALCEQLSALGYRLSGKSGRTAAPRVGEARAESRSHRAVPELIPVRRRALQHLISNPKFAGRFRAHSAISPQKPFMRAALEEHREAIFEELRKALQGDS